VSRDFLPLVVITNQFSPTPEYPNAPPVSTTPAANFASRFASVVDTGGKFAAGVNDSGGNLPPVSMTPANLPAVSN
jgi:hypothetical protein